ncbi:DNA repair protein RecO [Marinobacter zhejiangensis]|uniref:DNA repair protein RecO n=1 Tax=Marinobacter zhejiangensis TaxID=488535 RepID=A0A1I4N9K5_9GAMM|nr:DNA repair protein RecO [Marinobacter zhejiangensis]SFM12158.1 DNA replication and repair protein RecO [Marinobacter zhejiangensis]
MSGSVQGEPAYVLHRRAYRETSLLVDLFSLNAGRLTVVAKGANSSRSPLKAQLQPFQPVLVDWQGRTELKTLVQVEVRQADPFAGTVGLYSGLYINELLQRVLPAGDPHPELFAAYIEALSQLVHSRDVEPVLRRFEVAFAYALGYGFDWAVATDIAQTVEAGYDYCYDPEQGIVQALGPSVRLQRLPGSTLLQLAEGDFESEAARKLAKRVMRVLVDYLMQGKPLHSRSLFLKG